MSWLDRARHRLGMGAGQVWHDDYRPPMAPLARSLAQLPWTLHLRRWLGSKLGESPWSDDTFQIGGEARHYFDHRYNLTWLNERRVELSLALTFAAECRRDRLLEVGAVLQHYGVSGHDVVDRFEFGEDILNVDICEFSPERTYDRIVSVSTIEHVGWDQEQRRPGDAIRALLHLESLLSVGGKALVTLPAGYNANLDAAVQQGQAPGFLWRGFVRVDRANRWREVELAEALSRRYGSSYMFANGLLVGMTLP
jgi:hypothetical protein